MTPNEETLKARDRCVQELGLLDTPAEERFDRVTRLCQSLFEAPFSMVSFLQGDRQWFKSAQGLMLTGTPASESFCQHTINEPDGNLVVTDPQSDERFASLPAVTHMGIQFYAGTSLEFEGERIGTLCILDTKQREFDDRSARSLEDLAQMVQTELRLQALTPIERLLTEKGVKLSTDPVTRCWDEKTTRLLLEAVCEEGRNRGDERVTIYLVETNDTEETALRATADQLRREAGNQAMLGYLENSRFLLVFLGVGPDAVEAKGARVLGTLLAHRRRATSLSGIPIGAAQGKSENESAGSLLRRAEAGLKEASSVPGGGVRIGS